MKIALILLLATAFSAFSMDVHSQNAKVSIQNAQLRVEQVLKQIELQTEFLFVYNKQNVNVRQAGVQKAMQ